ncbi:hypothetical protein BT96DRAFT_946154 [Gymnopus androsaceus JB14]|uniref:Uncharacterized protein n=1 Tax=Gymnopus androsaceus JB14 TaxID=1447944 RepID=A0A6A4GX20_9AGAR|nr:hypothetical protein BT96DRAFT_946154 [Gymnopus androsaceus JB14]
MAGVGTTGLTICEVLEGVRKELPRPITRRDCGRTGPLEISYSETIRWLKWARLKLGDIEVREVGRLVGAGGEWIWTGISRKGGKDKEEAINEQQQAIAQAQELLEATGVDISTLTELRGSSSSSAQLDISDPAQDLPLAVSSLQCYHSAVAGYRYNPLPLEGYSWNSSCLL